MGGEKAAPLPSRLFLSTSAYSNRAHHAVAAKSKRLPRTESQKSGAKLRHLSPKYAPKHAILRRFTKLISASFSNLPQQEALPKKCAVKPCNLSMSHPLYPLPPHPPPPQNRLWDCGTVEGVIVRKSRATSVPLLTNVPRGTNQIQEALRAPREAIASTASRASAATQRYRPAVSAVRASVPVRIRSFAGTTCR